MSNVNWATGFTPDIAEEEIEAARTGGGGGGKDFMKLEVGDSRIRILPPLPGTNLIRRKDGTEVEAPYVKSSQHFINVPGQDSALKFNCPRVMYREECPVCKEGDALSRSGDPNDRKRASEYAPRMRVYYNVIDRNNEADGPKILAVGSSVHVQILGLFDPDKGGNMIDPDNGFDLIITRTGTGKLDTKYDVVASRNNTALGDPEWIAQQHDLQRLAAVTDNPDVISQLETIRATSGRAASRGAPPSRPLTARTAPALPAPARQAPAPAPAPARAAPEPAPPRPATRPQGNGVFPRAPVAAPPPPPPPRRATSRAQDMAMPPEEE